MRDADDSGPLACFLEDPEEEVVRVARGSSRGGKDECLWGGIIAYRSPPLKLRIDGYWKPDACVAALGLGVDLNAICDAAVDTETVLRLVVPPERKELAEALPAPPVGSAASHASISSGL